MNEPAQFLPWHSSLAELWLSHKERFAHAWLIHGLPGIGKRDYALAAAAALLCEQPEHVKACGICQACRWFSAGNHPDFRRIRPDAVAAEEGELIDEGSSQTKKTPSREIRVEQIRSLSSWFNTATHRGGWRVAVIYPAQAMNTITANALLKVLEEPAAHTLFLLTTDAPDLLLPTIVSRCRRMPLPVPSASVAAAWLEEQGVKNTGDWLAAAGGAPLQALKLSRSGGAPCPTWLQGFLRDIASGRVHDPGEAVSRTADALEGVDAAVWIDSLQRAFVDLSLATAGAPLRYFPSHAEAVLKVARRADPVKLSDTVKWLAEQRRVAGHPLSPRLFVHTALQRCARACWPTPPQETA